MPEFDPLDYHVIAETVVSALLHEPKRQLPLAESFPGAGVYLIYYTGSFALYAPITKQEQPIYVGRAIPQGGRKGSALNQIERQNSPSLFNRLRDHWGSLQAASNLDVADFQCRYLVVTPIWIGVAESLIIERLKPVWNMVVDGFGLHDPGITRKDQRKSDWDMLHPGRSWEARMQPGKSVTQIEAAVRQHFT